MYNIVIIISVVVKLISKACKGYKANVMCKAACNNEQV